MLTLKQLKKLLTGFFESHRMVAQVVYADDFDFAQERRLSYPVCNINDVDYSINDRRLNFNFKIVLADLADENIPGHEVEIVSDMLQVAEDFFAWLQTQDGFEFTRNAGIQKFVDKGGDRTAGVVFRIQIGVYRSINTCQIPLEG